MIIWFSYKDQLLTKILSSKLFVGIGLISYSLYLWHYPIFAFSRVTEFTQENIFKKIFVLILILFFSLISYFFIEKPARKSKNKFNKVILIIIFFIVVILIANFSTILTKGFEGRFFLDNRTKYKFDKRDYLLESIKFETTYDYDNYSLKENLLILGNSHGEDLLKILSQTYLVDKIYFNLGSPHIRKNNINFQLNYMYDILTNNKNFIQKIDSDFLRHVKKQYYNSELIIFATEYSKRDLEILDDLIKLLKKDNKKIIIFDSGLKMTNKSSFNLNRLDYFVYQQKRLPNISELQVIEKEMFVDLINKENINFKIEMMAKANNVDLIQRKNLFCDSVNKKCPALTNEGYKIYYDHSHITLEGAKFFAKKIQKDDLFLKYLSSDLKMKLN